MNHSSILPELQSAVRKKTSPEANEKLSLLAIVLSVLLRFMDSDYPFGIFKLFLRQAQVVMRLNQLKGL